MAYSPPDLWQTITEYIENEIEQGDFEDITTGKDFFFIENYSYEKAPKDHEFDDIEYKNTYRVDVTIKARLIGKDEV